MNFKNSLYKKAFFLSLFTIFYNIIEGVVSIYFGSTDETLALFGFGVDSFVEVLSGLGIAHMIWRIQHHNADKKDKFEITALKITGTAFYILAAGLVVGAGLAIYEKAKPVTTIAGIVIAAISILTMYFLYRTKLKVGKDLNSAPIIFDAHCTKACFYLSFIVLGSSIIYEVFKIPYIDALGSLGIAWYAFKEGKESFEKAANPSIKDEECC